jgi:hypothetical protein
MRCVKFDKEVIRALEAMGFGVEEDNESASMETTIDVMQRANEECLRFLHRTAMWGHPAFQGYAQAYSANRVAGKRRSNGAFT